MSPMRRLLTEILEEGVATGEFDPSPARDPVGPALSMLEDPRTRLLHGEIELDDAHTLVTRFTLRGLGVPTETIGTVLPHSLTQNHQG